jgi:hypothetical protein
MNENELREQSFANGELGSPGAGVDQRAALPCLPFLAAAVPGLSGKPANPST